MFYNCENLFDIHNDSIKLDDEFTPDGEMHWNYTKFKKKLIDVYKVIAAVGAKNAPDIIGLCEIENRFVLEQLTQKTPLKKFGYKIVHKESPDKRGIDVALLYNPKTFDPISYKAVEINFPFNSSITTRDILYVSGKIMNDDIIHIFINHWPSRYGGQKPSEKKRLYTAEVLKKEIDKIYKKNLNSNIIILGDLNDGVDDKSLTKVLLAENNFDTIQPQKIYNLLYDKGKQQLEGTIKYRGVWRIFDQILVSGNLLSPQNSTTTSRRDSHIFQSDFLLEKDIKYTGSKVKRTFIGRRYNGGYSDHLPVYIDIYSK